jgi:hypothetical protein
MSPSATSPPRRLRRVELDGYTVIADRGFAGAEFETLMAALGAIFLGLADADGPQSVARFADVIAAFRPAA